MDNPKIQTLINDLVLTNARYQEVKSRNDLLVKALQPLIDEENSLVDEGNATHDALKFLADELGIPIETVGKEYLDRMYKHWDETWGTTDEG